jgi:hypothetical protein
MPRIDIASNTKVKASEDLRLAAQPKSAHKFKSKELSTPLIPKSKTPNGRFYKLLTKTFKGTDPDDSSQLFRSKSGTPQGRILHKPPKSAASVMNQHLPEKKDAYKSTAPEGSKKHNFNAKATTVLKLFKNVKMENANA